MNPHDTISPTQRITLTADCVACGATKTITGNRSTWQRWRDGHISSDQAFSRLSIDDRRWLLSGLCPNEFTERTTP
jgi:hypothetical protein